MLNRYTLLDLRSGGLEGQPRISPKASDKERAAYHARKKIIKKNGKSDRDVAPGGVLRGARTTLDAVRNTSRSITGITHFAGVAQFAGIGCTPLRENEFHLGGSSAFICAEEMGPEEDAPLAVKVWIFLENGDDDRVRAEYQACHASGEFEVQNQGYFTQT